MGKLLLSNVFIVLKPICHRCHCVIASLRIHASWTTNVSQANKMRYIQYLLRCAQGVENFQFENTVYCLHRLTFVLSCIVIQLPLTHPTIISTLEFSHRILNKMKQMQQHKLNWNITQSFHNFIDITVFFSISCPKRDLNAWSG